MRPIPCPPPVTTATLSRIEKRSCMVVLSNTSILCDEGCLAIGVVGQRGQPTLAVDAELHDAAEQRFDAHRARWSGLGGHLLLRRHVGGGDAAVDDELRAGHE